MAKIPTPSFLFFIALLFLSSIHASRHPKNQKTDTRFSFSLPLRPIDSIRNPQNPKNYTARTISRLAADKVRVKSINSKHQHALNSELYDTESSPISYLNGGHNGYIVPIGVGQPAQEFHLLADTGSDITWARCSPGGFDPSKSTTYNPLPFLSEKCSALSVKYPGPNGICNYIMNYGDGGESKGEFATETLSFGPSSSSSIKNVAIGCDHEDKNKGYDGILGLGWKESIGFPSQINATSFSYCLVDPDSTSSSTLEFNSGPPQDSVVVSMRRNPTSGYYYVELTGITVGQDEIRIQSAGGLGRTIVDSGTWATYLDPLVYSSLIESFTTNAQGLKPAGNDPLHGFDKCYYVPFGASGISLFRGLPAMSLMFSDGQTVPLPPENYLVRVDQNNHPNVPLSTFCLAFQPNNRLGVQDIGFSIIGYSLQQRMRITYDLGNQQIGFSPNKCGSN